MIPPMISADFSNLEPNTLPIFTPKTEKAKVVRPMIRTDDHSFTWIQAKETPTAKASMLVAMARSSMVLKLSGVDCFVASLLAMTDFSSSSFPNTASRIMLAPIKKSNPKAIQWS